MYIQTSFFFCWWLYCDVKSIYTQTTDRQTQTEKHKQRIQNDWNLRKKKLEKKAKLNNEPNEFVFLVVVVFFQCYQIIIYCSLLRRFCCQNNNDDDDDVVSLVVDDQLAPLYYYYYFFFSSHQPNEWISANIFFCWLYGWLAKKKKWKEILW